jgi:hypothetical protein
VSIEVKVAAGGWRQACGRDLSLAPFVIVSLAPFVIASLVPFVIAVVLSGYAARSE